MFSRIALFLATNFAVLVLAGIIMSLLGVQSDQLGGLLVIGAATAWFLWNALVRVHARMQAALRDLIEEERAPR